MDNFCRCLCLLGKEIGFMERALQLFSKQKYIFAVQSPIVSKTKLGDIAQGWALVEVSMFKKDVFHLVTRVGQIQNSESQTSDL